MGILKEKMLAMREELEKYEFKEAQKALAIKKAEEERKAQEKKLKKLGRKSKINK